MFAFRTRVSVAIAIALAALAACAQSESPAAPVITVYKSPTCQCCARWAEHLERNGFTVKLESANDLASVRRELGVPDRVAACHTAKVGDYLVEGHVPAADIRRLLFERPRARGIATPGMPIGSPGMEQGDRKDPYDVLLFQPSGETRVFASH